MIRGSTRGGDRLVILRGTAAGGAPDAGDVVRFDEVRDRLRAGDLSSVLWRYPEVVLRTPRSDVMTRPLLTGWLLRLLSRGTCRIEDDAGNVEAVTTGRLVRDSWDTLGDLVGIPALLRRTTAETRGLETRVRERSSSPRWNRDRPPVYFRTDPWYGLHAGGSVAHIAGVLNGFAEAGLRPRLVTTDEIPTLSPDIPVHRVSPPRRYRDLGRVLSIWCDRVFREEAARELERHPPGFIYARYAVYSTAAAHLATEQRVPLVLEYNGSETWVNRHWGRPLRYEKLAERIERLDLDAADLIVVVSEALRRELVGRGISPGKILVNSNGVDPQRFRPDLDGGPVRAQLGVGDETVVGFIGSFGPWHGAEILAEAFGRLLTESPAYRGSLRLLLIGDGPRRPEVERRLRAAGVEDRAILTGTVPQGRAPEHLAACDILVSPHVGNPDGTEFFGSPTKLFEYMAMGKGIVASDLAQIGDVLGHDETAWLVPPGDVAALAAGIRTLVESPSDRARLGAAARTKSVHDHTWRGHTGRILARLEERCG